jgi:hypothetical protein
MKQQEARRAHTTIPVTSGGQKLRGSTVGASLATPAPGRENWRISRCVRSLAGFASEAPTLVAPRNVSCVTAARKMPLKKNRKNSGLTERENLFQCLCYITREPQNPAHYFYRNFVCPDYLSRKPMNAFPNHSDPCSGRTAPGLWHPDEPVSGCFPEASGDRNRLPAKTSKNVVA